MNGMEVKQGYIRPEKLKEVCVMAISPSNCWVHILDGEEVPDDGTFMVVLLPMSLDINQRVHAQMNSMAEIMKAQAILLGNSEDEDEEPIQGIELFAREDL